MSIALLIVPDFLLVALGWILHHKLGFKREFFAGCERLTYYVLFPALLISSILRTPISLGNAATLLQGTMMILVSGMALAWLAVPVLKPTSMAHASTAQCAWRFNTYIAYIALALSASLGGPAGQTVMALIVGFAVPVANLGAVYALARHSGGNLFGELLRNPLVVATVIALVGNFAGIQLPGPIDTVMSRLGAAAIALGIICVGAALSWQGGKGNGLLVGWMVAIKLIALPLVALGVVWLLSPSKLEGQMLVLFAALPCASAAYVLAMRMGGDGRLVALIVSLGTLMSVATLPLWLSVVS